MKNYEQLSRLGKLRRPHGLAENARLDPAEWWGETAVPFYTALFERYLANGELIRPLRV